MKQPSPKGFTTTRSKTTPIHTVKKSNIQSFLKTQSDSTQKRAKDQAWNETGRTLIISDTKGHLSSIAFILPDEIGLYSFASAPDWIQNNCDESIIKRGFHLNTDGFTTTETNHLYAAWSLASYQFDTFKKSNKIAPKLYIAPTQLKSIQPLLESIYLVRDLINMPPNKMAPSDLAKAAQSVAQNHKATIKIIKGEKLITAKFPLIYEVGKGSDNAPHLVDFTWGNPKHKKVTLVGKGVCFDTGGYDIKPSSAMLLMKKDMGGAAMALGLAHLIMSHKLPVRLRVLIPAAENSVSGKAYRPSDIITSRNGTTVEIGNTDAEGRLVMADCLTAACEENPDLLVDFSTLTGAARSALGFDLPALFSNSNETAQKIQNLSMECDDPLWHMPLWSPYKKDILSPIADINNAGSNPAGAVTAALFLDHFVNKKTKWVHIDHYAWEQMGRAGRPRGGTDMGMRTLFEFIKTLK